MRRLESFSAEDGQIKSISIDCETVKLLFETWDCKTILIIYEGIEEIYSYHAVGGDIGEYLIEFDTSNNINRYRFFDASENFLVFSICANTQKMYYLF